MKLPKIPKSNESKTKADSPHTHFHADVIKRASQNILTIKDHFSSFQDATMIPSEKTIDLKEGIIQLISGMRSPGKINISVDNAPGFQTLLQNKDMEMQKLKVFFIKTDELNKNANAVVDRGCQELEEEIRRLSPEGEKLNHADLKLAVLNLNSKLRRNGSLSAYEINSSRDQNTGENLNLSDKSLRSNQLKVRRTHSGRVPPTDTVKVGDTVTVKNHSDKHKANEMYLVTSKDKEKVKVQKLLHTLKKSPGKIMSKSYETNEKRMRVIHRPTVDDEEIETIPKGWKFESQSMEAMYLSLLN